MLIAKPTGRSASAVIAITSMRKYYMRRQLDARCGVQSCDAKLYNYLCSNVYNYDQEIFVGGLSGRVCEDDRRFCPQKIFFSLYSRLVP